jgi:TonB dependent receptor
VTREAPTDFDEEDDSLTEKHSRGDLASRRWSWIASSAALLRLRDSRNRFEVGMSERRIHERYAEGTVKLPQNRLTLQVGGRWDHFDATGQSVLLPRAAIALAPFLKAQLTVPAGQYAQFSSQRELCGEFGTPGPGAERATHEVVAQDRLLTDKLRVHVEAHNRQERDPIYSPETALHMLAGGGVASSQLGPVPTNSLDGYSRGVEISVHRRSANRFSGWVSYARSYTRHWQAGTSLSFWTDFAQRDTFTACGSWRLAPTVELSGSARYRSGYPLAGCIQGPLDSNLSPDNLLPFRLAAEPNRTRLSAYQRVDCRLNKAIEVRRYRATLYVEVAHQLDRSSWRYYDYLIPPTVQYVSLVGRFRATSIPFLPAAGVTFEFS